ncbi:protein TIFY 5A [Nicotiana tabacum]|uniref:Protein TIFY n=3 Tax=Nicotiana tabacum TaxID=4097 RepID=T1WMW5_TOBAC|nr:protein TIFY 5A-like [Nicotiana tomentosiformis]XP_016503822.1 PREDICTED: protein TIFY 5A-like [Nicotiana tabacum]XP_016514353.1 PREDICTED: protein TIFY 5A-like [Nicotiana tabacum]XP_033512409.1 protein TIFY 5A-like [Nicotiana tomentosiformis]AGU37283.1 jasmonate ZIM-domain protein 12a [Nicotiana tabacum]
MRRNCNLELRLVPPCVSFSPKDCTTTPYFSMRNNQSTEEKQQLTIFYNGKVVVSDATELQAKAIIYLASREMEENTKTSSPISEASSPLLQTQTGLSMKRSLQGFLQKRKNRIQATSPYHH